MNTAIATEQTATERALNEATDRVAEFLLNDAPTQAHARAFINAELAAVGTTAEAACDEANEGTATYALYWELLHTFHVRIALMTATSIRMIK